MSRSIIRNPFFLLTVLITSIMPDLAAQTLSKTDKLQTLSISDGSQFVPQKCYPKFSWETTPMYYMFGDSKHLLTPEEVAFIAEKTGFLTIEKSHGSEILEATELGAKHEAAAFKKKKPGIKVLYYFNSAWAWPFTSYNKNFTPEKINSYPELKKHLLVDPKTGELYYRDSYIRHTYAFDVLKPEFRKWWVDVVAKGVETSGCDGAFIDQMHGFYHLRRDKGEEVHKAQGKLLSELKKRLGPDKIVLGNNSTTDIARYAYPAVDACMFEHYDTKKLKKEILLQDWEQMLRIAKDGKMCVWRIGVDNGVFAEEYLNKLDTSLGKHERMHQLAKERIEYHLACFLIGAQPYSFFQYGWGWDLDEGSLYDYPELQKPLGAPKGAYTRLSPNGWEFTREFEHASVWLNTETGEAKITWKK